MEQNCWSEELLISKLMTTAIIDEKLLDKLMIDEKPELKKTFEVNKQNTYEEKICRNTKPEALVAN